MFINVPLANERLTFELFTEMIFGASPPRPLYAPTESGEIAVALCA
jgi:hypothetical protein